MIGIRDVGNRYVFLNAKFKKKIQSNFATYGLGVPRAICPCAKELIKMREKEKDYKGLSPMV